MDVNGLEDENRDLSREITSLQVSKWVVCMMRDVEPLGKDDGRQARQSSDIDKRIRTDRFPSSKRRSNYQLYKNKSRIVSVYWSKYKI